MATIIEGDAGLRPRRRYPWNEWSDGQQRRVEQGVDFDTSAENLRVQLYAQARRMGLRCSARLEGIVGRENVVVFRFYGHSG
jgi:hypothetical protein